MLLGAMEERPPFVRFERRPVEKRQLAPPDGDGSVYYVDTDFAIITPQGTKNVVEKQVDDWFAYLSQMVVQQRYNPEWLKAFRGAYGEWKNGQDITLNGSPLKNWPAITVSEIRKLADLHIYSIEDLASATEETLERLGMGGRSLRSRAQDWMTAKTGTAPLITELDALRVSNIELTREVASLRMQMGQLVAENEALRRKPEETAARPSLEDRLAAAQAALPAEEDVLTKL